MRSILRRIRLILRSLAHALFASAEDPRQTFAVAHHRQQQMLEKVRQAQSKLRSAKRQLIAKSDAATDKLPQLEEQARQALGEGREDLARYALRVRVLVEEELETLGGQLSQVDEEDRAMSLVEQRLMVQIQAVAARQELLEAQYSTAEAQVQVHEALGGVSDELDGLGDALEQAEQRTERMQARASALDRLVDAGVLDMPIEGAGDCPSLSSTEEQTTEAVEERLAALKRQAALCD